MYRPMPQLKHIGVQSARQANRLAGAANIGAAEIRFDREYRFMSYLYVYHCLNATWGKGFLSGLPSK
jgi:streptomycin 6-kinase